LGGERIDRCKSRDPGSDQLFCGLPLNPAKGKDRRPAKSAQAGEPDRSDRRPGVSAAAFEDARDQDSVSAQSPGAQKRPGRMRRKGYDPLRPKAPEAPKPPAHAFGQVHAADPEPEGEGVVGPDQKDQPSAPRVGGQLSRGFDSIRTAKAAEDDAGSPWQPLGDLDRVWRPLRICHEPDDRQPLCAPARAA